ncbi:MAG TPA: ABC-F family ATP-binding cassette domain-containing protein [Candidatus Saccharimonadales bacterium]|nr:ABC-F family ATP-binding cassette domain-containing protein [Candidatus Saccharimonadales bacterium]
MLLNVDIEAKTIGTKELFRNLHFAIEAKEKVAIIGRNGVGKTTLFNMLSGTDNDYSGAVNVVRGTRLVSTAQEHHAVADQTVIQYVLDNLPEYKQLARIIETYPETMGEDMKKIEAYSSALDRFHHLGYDHIEESIITSLGAYQITATMTNGPMGRLSGGQKRFVELVRVEHADADIALIDEPTNHMDFVAKEAFVNWLKATRHTVLVITHDRDVLQWVDKIIEIKDRRATVFVGNYQAYLKQNASTTTAKIHDYHVGLKTLDNLERKIAWARSRKPSWHGTADKRNPFEVMERRLLKEYDEIKQSMEKPSFWIDRESAEALRKDVGEEYEKFKAKNIRICRTHADKHSSELLDIEDLQLGYGGKPLFQPLRFRLQHGERLRLVGRNGAGKTTLVHAIELTNQGRMVPTLLYGRITCGTKLRLSAYEQELTADTMQLTLAEAVEKVYSDLKLDSGDQVVKRVLHDYLFDPREDSRLLVEKLSGGQKARLQIIKMLASNPNLLILDEPTNHLDLPSIEELENALTNYRGAVIYVSHDSYFAKNVEGEELVLKPLVTP